jgi:hypothetical protein
MASKVLKWQPKKSNCFSMYPDFLTCRNMLLVPNHYVRVRETIANIS